MTRTPTYRSWAEMVWRTTDPRSHAYADYGGRGIDVDPRWRASFEAFLGDLGERPANHSIERVDNDRGYWPDNCRWATQLEQNQNKRNNIRVELNGETVVVEEACRRAGLTRSMITHRRKTYGETHQQAIDYYVGRRHAP